MRVGKTTEKCYRSFHSGLAKGNNPEGDGGKNPGDGGGGLRRRNPGEKGKLEASGGGCWIPGDRSGYGDRGDTKFRNAVGDCRANGPGDGSGGPALGDGKTGGPGGGGVGREPSE